VRCAPTIISVWSVWSLNNKCLKCLKPKKIWKGKIILESSSTYGALTIISVWSQYLGFKHFKHYCECCQFLISTKNILKVPCKHFNGNTLQQFLFLAFFFQYKECGRHREMWYKEFYWGGREKFVHFSMLFEDISNFKSTQFIIFYLDPF